MDAMTDILKLSTLCLFIAAGPAAAQQTIGPDEESPTELESGLSSGFPLDDDESATVGQLYNLEVISDWTVRCLRAAEGDDPCEIYQLLRDPNGVPVAEMSVFAIPDGGRAVAGANIVTPLETLLTEGVTINVDGGAARQYPFSWCSVEGCHARIGLTAEDLDAFRQGTAARMRIVPIVAPNQNVVIEIPLAGFTAAFVAADPGSK